MFIITLTYKVPLAIVDQHLTAHRDYLSACYRRQALLMSGPMNPRTGGIMISPLKNRTEIDALIHADPFYINKIADYNVVEFMAVKYQAVLQNYL